jgi:hypothetical protein
MAEDDDVDSDKERPLGESRRFQLSSAQMLPPNAAMDSE